MPRKISPPMIYRQRRDNYVFHFEQRQLFKVLPLEEQLLYQKWSVVLPPPRLNVWGAGIYAEEEWTGVIRLALSKNLKDAFLLVRWYVSEEGWQEFQRDWQALPDVLHLPPEDPLWLYLYGQSVKESTWEDAHAERELPKRK